MSETQGIAFSGLRVVLDSLEDNIDTHGDDQFPPRPDEDDRRRDTAQATGRTGMYV